MNKREAQTWNAALQDCTFAFVDLEFTGDDAERDEPIEVAVVRARGIGGAIEQQFVSRIRPTVSVTPGALTVHGIDDASLLSAPDFASVKDALRAALDGTVTVAHGTALDLPCLARAYDSVGETTPLVEALDSLVLARRAVCARRYTLGALSERLSLPPRAWHSALSDALGTKALFDAIAPSFHATSARDLSEVRVGQRDSVHVRSSIVAAIERALESREAVTAVVRANATDARALRGVIEWWDAPHLRLRTAGGSPQVVRADRLLSLGPSTIAPPSKQ